MTNEFSENLSLNDVKAVSYTHLIECNYSSYYNTSPKEEQNWKTQKIIWNVKETECIIP